MARIEALAVALCCSALMGGTPRQAIFIDRSGSMRPYYQQGIIDAIAHPLETALSGLSDYREYAFSLEVIPSRSLQEIEAMPFGSLTFIDKVIETASKNNLGVAWIITDNIEDTGTAEAGNIEKFYARLRTDLVQRVVIFPVRVTAGKPGLIVYALLLDPSMAETYERGIGAFRKGADGVLHTDALRMKPLEHDTVQVSFYKAPVNSRGSEKTYETGAPIRETIEIRFKSTFDHIQIVDSAIKVADAEPKFQDLSLLVPEQRIISVTPDRVKTLGPGDETDQVYTVRIDLGDLKLKKSPQALWKAAWGKPEEEARLDTRFIIEVPQSNFRLRSKFLDEFDAATVEEARKTGKVYAINRLPSLMSGKITQVQVDSPLVFKVKYPAWPAFLCVFLVLAALGLLVGAALLVHKLTEPGAKSWKITAEAAGGRPLTVSIERQAVFVEVDRIGRIERNEFVPENGLRLDKGGERLPLANGLSVHARASRREFDLKFEDAGGPGRASKLQEPDTPVRRR